MYLRTSKWYTFWIRMFNKGIDEFLSSASSTNCLQEQNVLLLSACVKGIVWLHRQGCLFQSIFVMFCCIITLSASSFPGMIEYSDFTLFFHSCYFKVTSGETTFHFVTRFSGILSCSFLNALPSELFHFNIFMDRVIGIPRPLDSWSIVLYLLPKNHGYPVSFLKDVKSMTCTGFNTFKSNSARDMSIKCARMWSSKSVSHWSSKMSSTFTWQLFSLFVLFVYHFLSLFCRDYLLGSRNSWLCLTNARYVLYLQSCVNVSVNSGKKFLPKCFIFCCLCRYWCMILLKCA